MSTTNATQARRFPKTGQPEIRLPDQWTEHIKSGILCAIAAASSVIAAAHARTARRHRLRAELDRAENEIRLLREEMAIKDARWKRARPRRRPHGNPPRAVNQRANVSFRGGFGSPGLTRSETRKSPRTGLDSRPVPFSWTRPYNLPQDQ